MKIIAAEEKHFSFIKEFIQPYEFKCVLLSSYIRRKAKNIYLICKNENTSILPVSADDICGVFYFEKTLLHCIPNLGNSAQCKNTDEFESLFLEFFNGKQIKCIDGEQTATNFFVNLLQKKDMFPFQVNNYNLMICKEINSAPEKLSEDDEVRRCTEQDLEILLELQREYICKEVAPRGKNPSDMEIAMGLRQILKNQLCLSIFFDDKPVAKANTNAIGINWVQLGGIYTHPRFRRNYYAWHLVSAICRRVAKSGKKTALFVKDINVPAIDLYKKIGFEEAGKFQIAYF